MRKKYLSALLTVSMGVCVLTGCQQTPKASENGEIAHAKSSVEQAVEDVASRGAIDGADTLAEQGGVYDKVIGTQENGIWVCAEVPAVANKIDRLVLKAREDLDETALDAFLGSQNGTVQDITQQYLAEQEARLNAPPVEVDAGDGIELSTTVEMAHFGDDSALVFSDREREAAFYWNTTASFEDEGLMQKYGELWKEQEKELSGDQENKGAVFPMAQAKALLMEKLKPVSVTEVDFSKIYYYERGDMACYEMYFTPRYEGVKMAQEFGSVEVTEVIPSAMAWVTDAGVAELNLWHALGEVKERKEEGTVLSFSQVEEILEKYLESGMLVGCAEAKLTRTEVVYYPVCREEESALELIPAWHIYIPLDEYVSESGKDGAYKKLFEKNAAWNIYMDAVTGELLRVE